MFLPKLHPTTPSLFFILFKSWPPSGIRAWPFPGWSIHYQMPQASIKGCRGPQRKARIQHSNIAWWADSGWEKPGRDRESWSFILAVWVWVTPASWLPVAKASLVEGLFNHSPQPKRALRLLRTQSNPLPTSFCVNSESELLFLGWGSKFVIFYLIATHGHL